MKDSGVLVTFEDISCSCTSRTEYIHLDDENLRTCTKEWLYKIQKGKETNEIRKRRASTCSYISQGRRRVRTAQVRPLSPPS